MVRQTHNAERRDYMSYEAYRNDVYCEVSSCFEQAIVDKLMDFMDKVAERFIFEKKSHDLILYGGIPEDLIKAYIASKAVANVTKGTLKNYYCVLRHLFEVVKVPVQEITSNTIRIFLNHIQQVDGNRPVTANGKRTILHDFFKFCVDNDVLRKNPCDHVYPIKYYDNIREPIENIELETIRLVCKDTREKLLVEFLFSTGCRAAEVAAMQIRDLDLTEHTATVQHGKGNKKRVTFLNAKTIVLIKKYLQERGEDGCEYLFVSKKWKNNKKYGIKSRALQAEIRRIIARTGITRIKITPHNFRHTTGSHASESGMPIEEIQEMLGHASIKTTRRYVKVNKDNVKHHHWQYMQ